MKDKVTSHKGTAAKIPDKSKYRWGANANVGEMHFQYEGEIVFFPGYFWEDALMGKLHESGALLCRRFGKVIPRSVRTSPCPAESCFGMWEFCFGVSVLHRDVTAC